jgi:hypothetical protein
MFPILIIIKEKDNTNVGKNRKHFFYSVYQEQQYNWQQSTLHSNVCTVFSLWDLAEDRKKIGFYNSAEIQRQKINEFSCSELFFSV